METIIICYRWLQWLKQNVNLSLIFGCQWSASGYCHKRDKREYHHSGWLTNCSKLNHQACPNTSSITKPVQIQAQSPSLSTYKLNHQACLPTSSITKPVYLQVQSPSLSTYKLNHQACLPTSSITMPVYLQAQSSSLSKYKLNHQACPNTRNHTNFWNYAFVWTW